MLSPILHRAGIRFLLTFVCCLAAKGQPQTASEFWPGARYDPAIPSIQKVLGYESGERISSHAELMRYFDALAAAAPDRFRVVEYARSWEGRKLVYGVLASPANLKRSDAIGRGMNDLADPRRTSPRQAAALIDSLPAVIWLGYGVHGNEISSPDAALLTAYHLLASQQDPLAEEILTNVVVLIDPTQNPDGRDRFVHHFQQSLGLEPDASRLAAEHDEPWPGGRTNHYYFDLNRDWFALTQPETRGRIKALRQWRPLVFADLHEMGADSTYYFAPEAVPYNPHLAPEQRASLELFGKNNARWFDQFGFSYFVREIFDAFYPGYGASWPSFYGSVAMTYEQASARGLLVRRTDETILHFRDGIQRHFVASVSTAETAARQRKKLLQDFYRYGQTAIEEGQTEDVRAYLLPRNGDTSAVDKLAAVLGEQGVEIHRAGTPLQGCGGEHPAGSYLISLAQPAKRLIRTLLDPHVPMDKDFMEEQERRRRKDLPDEIYDVTAWSLPLMYNVPSIACAETPAGELEKVDPVRIPPRRVAGGPASVAYLVPWGSAAAGRWLSAALRRDLRVHSTDKSFVQQGRTFPRGTLIVRVQENPPDVHQIVEDLAKSSGAEVVASESGWVDSGASFGSNYVVHMRRPAIALAWDEPTRSYSAGTARFVLERQFGYPVTPIRSRRLASADLSRFQVLILPSPSGEYREFFKEPAVERLKSWVSAGGTLIGIGGAVSFLAHPEVKLLEISQESTPPPSGEPKKDQPSGAATEKSEAAGADSGRVPGKLLATEEDYLKAIQPDSELPDPMPGALVTARLDPDHWITAGLGETVHALVEGRAIFTPIKLDKGVNAAVFLGPEELLASGYLWEDNRRQMAYKPLVAVQGQGRGVVVGFTTDPNYRAYLDGMNILFLNAVFRGPAHARPEPAE